MKKVVFGFAFGLLLAAASHGAAIVVAAGIDNGLSVSNATNANNATDDVAINNLIRVGYFNLSNAEIQANASDLLFLNQNFVEFGTVKMGDAFNMAGHFQGTINNPNSDALGFAGKQVYVWVFSASDNSSLTRTLATATDHGIFSRNPADDLDWRFKATSDIPNNSTIDFTDLSNGGALASGAQILVGSFPKGTSQVTSAPNFALASVPEPSVAAAALCGGVALLLRRRRSA